MTGMLLPLITYWRNEMPLQNAAFEMTTKFSKMVTRLE